jgi:gas vesicle protein
MKNKTIFLGIGIGIVIGLVLTLLIVFSVEKETLFLGVTRITEEKDSKNTYPALNDRALNKSNQSQGIDENLFCVRKGWHWTVHEGTARYQSFQCDSGYRAVSGGIYHAYSSPVFLHTQCWSHPEPDKWYCMVDNRTLVSRTFSVWINCCKIRQRKQLTSEK